MRNRENHQDDSEVEEQGRRLPREPEWDPRIRRPREDSEVEEQGRMRMKDEDASEVDEQRWTHR